VTLLDGVHLAPPERLPAVVEAAGEALGASIAVHLVDYDQDALHPLAGPGEPLGIDTTLPGLAFRAVRTIPVTTGAHPVLWVPLLDGVERLGVLEVTILDGADPRDPRLQQECRWVAALIGHLVTIITDYGDGVDLVRLRKRRNTAAELVWSLLPPLTAGTDDFVLAGVLEPCYEVGGDAFDYSLSGTSVSLAVFDAVGHTLRSGLIAAVALAAYRGARHQGRELAEQAEAVDEVIADQFDHGAFATGVLAELDLSTGRLRYVNAGHPAPLVLRSGKVVKALPGRHRRPFGLGRSPGTVGEVVLQPEDWLVLHTDGITEARDGTGAFFGEDRLVDFLEREAASGHPPPETVRRLVKAVLAHQHGVLQDDATVLLGRWSKWTGAEH
jgi:hypothetical protein